MTFSLELSYLKVIDVSLTKQPARRKKETLQVPVVRVHLCGTSKCNGFILGTITMDAEVGLCRVAMRFLGVGRMIGSHVLGVVVNRCLKPSIE